MARITPSEGNFTQLEDDEPYQVELVDLQWTKSSPQYGEEDRMELTWHLVGMDKEDTLKDWVGLKLGESQAGVSKLRMLCNALAGVAEGTAIAWFDTETLEWSYDGSTAAGSIQAEAKLVVRGMNEMKSDGSGRRFRIKKYKAPKAATAAAAPSALGRRPAAAAPAPAPAATSAYDSPGALQRAASRGRAAAAVPAAAANPDEIPF